MIAAVLSRLGKLSNWLTIRRIRAQAVILVVCLWSVAIVDFSASGPFDRVGNIKFQDFLPLYTAGKLVSQHRTGELFDLQAEAREAQAVLPHPVQVQLPFVYGPQVGLFFAPFSRIPFLSAAALWAALSGSIYLICCYWIWQSCPALYAASSLITLIVLAFPPFFHFMVRGQLSSVILFCFVAAYYAFRRGHDWLAGLALGSLIFKPQFVIAVVLVLLFAQAWKSAAGILAGCGVQLALTWTYFGSSVMRTYVSTLWHLPQIAASLEPGVSQAQMHSLRSFFMLLFPWPAVALVFYAVGAIMILCIAVQAWSSLQSLELRFSILVLSAVLVNPHLFVYDLLVLAPLFFLVADWTIRHAEHSRSPAVRALLYLSFLLPLFGPLAIWIHIQLSVIAFVGLLMVLTSILRESAPANHLEGLRD